MLELIIGQIPEAIFFSLFMIYAKGLKEKRILFTILMIVEYVLLTRFLIYNIWFQIIYTFMTFVILKILYKEKTQITDIFTFAFSSLILMLCSLLSYLLSFITFKSVLLASIIKVFLLILILKLLKNKINNIQNIYKKYWNRNDKIKKKIKSVTFRSIMIIIFNLMFYILNLGIIYLLLV